MKGGRREGWEGGRKGVGERERDGKREGIQNKIGFRPEQGEIMKSGGGGGGVEDGELEGWRDKQADRSRR